jgi:GTPase
VRALESLYEHRIHEQRFVTPEVARRLTEISLETGRQVAILADRRGHVVYVVVGDAHAVHLPDLGRQRAGESRFRGLRLIHTHLRQEPLSKDDLTDLALLRLDAVIAIFVGRDGLPGELRWACLLPPTEEEGQAIWRVESRTTVHGWDDDFFVFIQDLEAQFKSVDRGRRVGGGDGAIAISVAQREASLARLSLSELVRLAEAAGLIVLDRMLQVRPVLDGRTLVGKGKVQEILLRAMHLGAEILLFDQDLSPSQLRNIAETTDLKVLDRTQLILDIFAQRATTREGRLQVEIAQLRYRRPRLAIMPTAMSRLTGGIGGRGPGETRLEINRRRADERLTRLERELSHLAEARALRRARRKRVGLPLVSIVGYTNAGKSTLLNTITRSAVQVRDQLFSTLDPTSRRFRFPEERDIILTDTVGFIRRLPPDLVHAFRATLEEVAQADLLLHVVDAGDPEIAAHEEAVRSVLEELGAGGTPVILVLNKIDTVPVQLWPALAESHQGLLVSATDGTGLEALLAAIESRLFFRRAKQLEDDASRSGRGEPDSDRSGP